MTARFRPAADPAAAVQTARVRAHLEVVAEDVQRRAQLASPTGTSRTGYRGRFKRRVTATSAQVGNTDIAAHLIEYGSVNNPPYAPLRRAVKAAGLNLTDRHST